MDLPRLLRRGALVVLAHALQGCGGAAASDGADAPAAPAVQSPASGSGSGSGAGSTPPANPPVQPPAQPAATACDSATGRVLQVGPGQAYATPSAAAAVAQAGDVIRIAAGDYRGDVATWRADRLTLCGSGGRARLFADGRSAQGKAIWVTAGADAVVDNVEFHGATVPDQNGAGIRAEGRNLTVRNSGFYDNENGILGGDAGAMVVESSEFARNGFGDGYSHNIYVSTGDSLTVRASFFRQARVGHNLKSRARVTRIENSYFMDGPQGNASYQIDTPNGGEVYLRGNLIHKGPNASNSIAVAYGAEGLRWPVNTLELVHNTLVSTRSGGTFVSAPSGTQSVRMTANVFAGKGGTGLMTGGFATASIVQQGNRTLPSDAFAGADDVAAPAFWPTSLALADFALSAVFDVSYSSDAPAPMRTRALTTAASQAGALQSAPR